MQQPLSRVEVLIGDIFGIVDVDPFGKQPDIAGDLELHAGIELEMTVDIAILARLGTQLIQIAIPIGTGETEIDRPFFIAEYGVERMFGSAGKRNVAQTGDIAIGRNLARSVGKGIVEIDQQAIQRIRQEAEGLGKTKFDTEYLGAGSVDRNHGFVIINAEQRPAIVVKAVDNEILDVLVKDIGSDRAIGTEIIFRRSIKIPRFIRLKIGIAEFTLALVVVILLYSKPGCEILQIGTDDAAIAGSAQHQTALRAASGHNCG